jgi:hypothetical protein
VGWVVGNLCNGMFRGFFFDRWIGLWQGFS